MATDDERREVARRLRGARYGWRSWERALYDALGVDTETAGLDMLDRLADLIDPDHVGDSNKMVDRDALLKLADEIDRKSNDGTTNPDPMRPLATSLDLFGYARRIRDALGVVE